MPNSFLPGPAHDDEQAEPLLAAPMQRRRFFQLAGATASVAALALAGCSDDDEDAPAPPTISTIDVGAADVGVLIFAQALKQVELAFYTAVRAGAYYRGLMDDSAEKQILSDLEEHETLHVTFLKSAVASISNTALRQLDTDFANIDFGTRLTAAGATRLGVLNAAMLFEDLGVAALNGAARYLTSAPLLLYLGKIVSVEARHAALIRDLVSYNSFVGNDVVEVFTPNTAAPGDGNGTGLERQKTPAEVLTVLNTFLKAGSKLTATQLV